MLEGGGERRRLQGVAVRICEFYLFKSSHLSRGRLAAPVDQTFRESTDQPAVLPVKLACSNLFFMSAAL